MGKNPVNLALRFILELGAFAAIGYWGWTVHGGILRYLLGLGLPVLVAFAWGAFRVPNYGGPPLVRVPGLLRLALELAVFGFATWGLYAAGAVPLAWYFGGIVLLHYILSYDVVLWLIKQ